MTKRTSLGLSTLFLLIAVAVSGTLVLSVRDAYLVNGHAPALRDAISLLQRV